MFKKIITLVFVALTLGFAAQTHAQSVIVNIGGSSTGAPLGGSVTTAVTAPTCFGGATGTVTVTATGGTGSYKYKLDADAFGSATSAPYNGTTLVAGAHTVTIQNADASCTDVVVNFTTPAAPAQLAAAVSGTLQIVCGETAASATVTASGGTSSYTYSWPSGTAFTPSNPASGASTATGLAAGTYNVTVTDASGCATATTPTPVVITAPNATLAATVTATQILCNANSPGASGSTTGSIAITDVTSGATPVYTWSSNATGASGTTASGLAASTTAYSVTISAVGYCDVVKSATINAAPSQVTGTAGTVTNDACQLSAGEVTITGTGGTGAKTINWTATAGTSPVPSTSPAGGSPGGTANSASGTTFTGLTGNYSYKFVLKDANGCTTQ